MGKQEQNLNLLCEHGVQLHCKAVADVAGRGQCHGVRDTAAAAGHRPGAAWRGLAASDRVHVFVLSLVTGPQGLGGSEREE